VARRLAARLNHRNPQALRFYALDLSSLLLAAVIILIPGLPFNMMAEARELSDDEDLVSH
jgi:hypothetical protein